MCKVEKYCKEVSDTIASLQPLVGKRELDETLERVISEKLRNYPTTKDLQIAIGVSKVPQPLP
jgi:hypothetical protein